MTTVLSLLAVGFGTAVIFGYLAFIWWLDRYEREPLWLVGVAFVWGAVGGTCFGCAISLPLSQLAIELFGPEMGNNFGTVIVAPVVEEVTKALIFIPLFFSKHFDNETDGLIYGAAAGLGFAAAENLLYYSGTADLAGLVTLIFLRTAFTAIVHCVSTSLIGVAFGFAKHRVGVLGAIPIVGCGYLLAVGNHGVWNGIATATGAFGDKAAGLMAIGVLIVMCAAVSMFALTQFSLWREHKALAKVLRDEAALGTIPLAHANILPFWLKRRKSDWVPRHVDKKQYIKLSTLLAFRVHQAAVAGERAKQEAAIEIAELRQKVQQLLAGPR